MIIANNGDNWCEETVHRGEAGSERLPHAAPYVTQQHQQSTTTPLSFKYLMDSKEAAKIITVSVVGLSGTERETGGVGVGKSCLCNRFVSPRVEDYHHEHISNVSQVDFGGRIINNDHWLYWGERCILPEASSSSSSGAGGEGSEICFRVVEQTEFLDDESFQPMRGNSKEPYVKRCAATKLSSSDKLMYICKEQLGMEHDYEERSVPDGGKLNVDGFLCAFDVSQPPNSARSIDIASNFTAHILQALVKTKKPIVFMTTKNDERSEQLSKEAERILHRKECRYHSGLIPLVETSAVNSVNVETAFLLLASLIDKTRAKPKVLSYTEAARHRFEVLEVARTAYLQKVRSFITDHRSSWSMISKTLYDDPDFVHYCELFGRDSARKLFYSYQRELRDRFMMRSLQVHMSRLPEIFAKILPDDLTSLRDKPWDSIVHYISTLPDFPDYFYAPGTLEKHVDQGMDPAQRDDTRICAEVLRTQDAEMVFRNHLNSLEAEQRRLKRQEEFLILLGNCPQVTPGKPLTDVRIFLMGKEPYESLSDADVQQIYDQHMRHLNRKARMDFAELLQEQVDEFVCRILFGASGSIPTPGIAATGTTNYQSRNTGTGSSAGSGGGYGSCYGGVVAGTDLIRNGHMGSTSFIASANHGVGGLTEQSLTEIHDKLQEDIRYRQLNRLHQVRDNMICQYIGFVSYPLRQHCPAHPRCIDALVEQILANHRASHPLPTFFPHYQSASSAEPSAAIHPLVISDSINNSVLHLVLLGTNGLTQDLYSQIKATYPDDEYPGGNENVMYRLECTVAADNASLDDLSQICADLRSRNLPLCGLMFVFSSRESYEYTKELLISIRESRGCSYDMFLGLPTVLLLACDPGHIEDLPFLNQHGSQLAERMNCIFIGVQSSGVGSETQDRRGSILSLISEEQVVRSIDSLVAALKAIPSSPRLPLSSVSSTTEGELTVCQTSSPDLRILVCLMCGDDFSPQLILAPFLNAHMASVLPPPYSNDSFSGIGGGTGDATSPYYVSSPPPSSIRSHASSTDNLRPYASSLSTGTIGGGSMIDHHYPGSSTARLSPYRGGYLAASRRDRSITFEIYSHAVGRKLSIEVTFTAYHTGFIWLSEGLYYAGYILVYSAKRRASLAHLDSFAHLVPEPIPILLAAVGEVSEFFSDQSTNALITEGNEIADRIGGNFITMSRTAADQKIAVFQRFFNEVYVKKPEVEASGWLTALEDLCLFAYSSDPSPRSFAQQQQQHQHQRQHSGPYAPVDSTLIGGTGDLSTVMTTSYLLNPGRPPGGGHQKQISSLSDNNGHSSASSSQQQQRRMRNSDRNHSASVTSLNLSPQHHNHQQPVNLLTYSAHTTLTATFDGATTAASSRSEQHEDESDVADRSYEYSNLAELRSGSWPVDDGNAVVVTPDTSAIAPSTVYANTGDTDGRAMGDSYIQDGDGRVRFDALPPEISDQLTRPSYAAKINRGLVPEWWEDVTQTGLSGNREYVTAVSSPDSSLPLSEAIAADKKKKAEKPGKLILEQYRNVSEAVSSQVDRRPKQRGYGVATRETTVPAEPGPPTLDVPLQRVPAPLATPEAVELSTSAGAAAMVTSTDRIGSIETSQVQLRSYNAKQDGSTLESSSGESSLEKCIPQTSTYSRVGRKPTPHKRTRRKAVNPPLLSGGLHLSDRIRMLNEGYGPSSSSKGAPLGGSIATGEFQYFNAVALSRLRTSFSAESLTALANCSPVILQDADTSYKSGLGRSHCDTSLLDPSYTEADAKVTFTIEEPSSACKRHGSVVSPSLIRRMASSFRFRPPHVSGFGLRKDRSNSQPSADSKSVPESPSTSPVASRRNPIAFNGVFVLPPFDDDDKFASFFSELGSGDEEDSGAEHDDLCEEDSGDRDQVPQLLSARDLHALPKNAAAFLRSPRREDRKERKTSRDFKPKKISFDRFSGHSSSGASHGTPYHPPPGVGGRPKKKSGSLSGPVLLPSSVPQCTLQDLAPSRHAPIPLFVQKCVEFIEVHGLNVEGIYRVCGNQAQVALLEQKFLEDPLISFHRLDIPVNAVATALKNFFSFLSEPVVPYSMYDDLMQAMSLPEEKTRLVRIKDTLRRLPHENLQLLKFFIRHLRKVAHHAHETSMDHQNLAKCWWPTLLRPHFDNFEAMVGMTQRLEDFVQLLLEEYEALFEKSGI